MKIASIVLFVLLVAALAAFALTTKALKSTKVIVKFFKDA